MQLSCLRIVNLRSIECSEVLSGPGINLIIGRNGSGKTTILEAIHILHCGKSFRTANYSDLVRHGESHLAISGFVAGEDSDEPARQFRLLKNHSGREIRVNNVAVRSASTLSRMFPILLFDASSFGVIEGSPKLRRSLVDKAVFHVEPKYIQLLQRYVKVLQQRNQLLRNGGSTDSLEFWDKELINSATDIDQARNLCVHELNKMLANDTFLEPFGGISLEYKSGWKEGESLKEALRNDRSRDLSVGMTNSGPHKAELRIKRLGRNLAKTASRGQTKTIVLSVMLAILESIYMKTNERPVFLVDDITAELDTEWVNKMLARIASSAAQAFVTTTEEKNIQIDSIINSLNKFHVELGAVYKVPPLANVI